MPARADRARPVVGVSSRLTALPPTTSVGRIWHHGLAGLAQHVTVRVVEEHRRAWQRRHRVDVWLTDGHQGAIDVPEPVVTHLLEAAWTDPDLRPLMDPAFTDLYERQSGEAAAAAARIITISESSRQQILAAYDTPVTDVVVAQLGVDHDTYRPGLPAPDDLLRKAGGQPGEPYVLFVSTVHPRKNLDALRGALALLAERGHPHNLVLVAGRAADRADSIELAKAAVAPIPGIEASPINLAGVADADVARLMAGASAFCLPSLMEGFGMAVAEAMACGAPVVVSDRGSLPEVVGEAGIVTGLEAASVADALGTVLTEPDRAASMRAAGLCRARDFTWDRMVEGWAGALRAVLDGSR